MVERLISTGDDLNLPDWVVVDPDNLAAAAAVKALLAASDAAGARAGIAAEVVDRVVYHASNHGVVGDGTTDDSTALQSLLNSAASLGLTAMLGPATTVRCVSPITLPSGCRLDLNGSTIKNASASTSGRVLNIVGVSDVWVGNGVIDGDKASFATATEQRHNVRIVNSSRVTLENILTKNAKGDGIYIGDDVSGICYDITLINFRADGNHRNGGSITGVRGFRQFGGYYRTTGGTAPQAGLDIEPNTNAVECSDGAFYGVNFDNNTGDGLLIHAYSATPTSRQAGWRFYGCTANNNTGNGVTPRWANDVLWDGGEIRGNNIRGVYLRDNCTNLSFNTDVVGNGQEGYGQPQGTVTGLRIQGLVKGNGTTGTFDGVNLASSGSFAVLDARFFDNTRYGVRTLAWTSVTLTAGCRFSGNTTGTVSLSDAAASRLVYAAGISGGVIPVGRSTTALRPAATDVSYGLWIDTTLNKVIWSNGTTWRDTMGNTV